MWNQTGISDMVTECVDRKIPRFVVLGWVVSADQDGDCLPTSDPGSAGVRNGPFLAIYLLMCWKHNMRGVSV